MNRWRWLAVLVGLLTGASSVAVRADEPVIDPDVRAGIRGGAVRVLVELHVPAAGPSSLGALQDEALRRLAGTGARLARRYSTAPYLALEIDAAALARLEEMRDLVARVRADRISPIPEGPARRR